MHPCDQYSVVIFRYLEQQLTDGELEDFCSHLAACPHCQASLEEERALSALLRRCRPLYSVSERFSSQIAALAARHDWEKRSSRRPSWRFGWTGIAACAAAIILVFLVVPQVSRERRAASYVQAAVAAHREYLRGDTPLELRSDSPEAVSGWLAGKVPFEFRLPASQAAPADGNTYQLRGAHLVKYGSTQAALVTYEAGSEKVSLLVASGGAAVTAGGDEVRSGRLTFHYYNTGNLRVATWSSHDVSYALVSPASGPKERSCLVCHQNMADRDVFRRVK